MSDKRDRLIQLYESTQARMLAELVTARTNEHAPTSGACAEEAWRSFLREHLPHRYAVDSAFVIDCFGNRSDQIDVVIYDRQYTPRIQEHGGGLWLPAESVYAVFEVKPQLDQGNIEYAAKKAASVRRLTRTSRPIKHAGGQFPAVQLPPILAGIVVDREIWSTPLQKKLVDLLEPLPLEARLDLGCAADGAAFDVCYEGGPAVDLSPSGLGLIYFVVKLVERLQALGTVPAIDFAAYLRAFETLEDAEA